MIPFSTYMYKSLYGSDGYYSSPHRVSRVGDFYTSVSASRFFGGAIAFYILSLLEKGVLNPPLHIVEIGADKGYLLGDIALFLDALSENLLNRCVFITIEPFESLAKAQKAHFDTLHCSTKLEFYTFKSFVDCSIAHKDTNLFIISNELFDSFPCDVIHSGSMLHITQNTPSWLGVWREYKCVDLLEKNGIESSPLDFSGIVPMWRDFIHSLGQFVKKYAKCYFVSFDYGAYKLEKVLSYNPRFYHKHQVLTLESLLQDNANFHLFYKQTDITYDVDFYLLDRLLCEEGFVCDFRKSQAKVLIEDMQILYLLESFAAQKGFKAYFKEIHKVKTLINDMGERFVGICYTHS